ncbi:MAG: APC family permease [Actinobacteria bacterium]|nr:APC family permease [Actinomycetota bacterium]
MPVVDTAKRFFFGRALRSDRLGETLLPKRIALPVFASDALSSNAYATQEILIVLALGGFSLYSFGPWVALAVVLLYFVVVASYRQNVHAYPGGGGDYTVVSHNLGPKWGVFTASALLVDYTLTVAVSISAAVANLGSVFPVISDHAAWWAVGIIILITLINLRGIRESGVAFAIPTYLFIASIAVLVGTGIIRTVMGADLTAESAAWEIIAEDEVTGLALAFLVARAFSSGTTALTGIEAIANGVPSFRKPKSRNAATTLLLLGVISMAMFASITWLALSTGVKVTGDDADLVGLPEGQPQKTVIVQVAQAVFGEFTIAVLVISLATALILALAANTAFNGFPVLGSILARDGYLPRQLHTRGDRLSYSNGIIVLAAFAVVLVIVFQADVSSLIQLYIIGVFVAFTLGQVGMLRHWNRELRRDPSPEERRRMQRSRVINAVGAALTGVVLILVLVTKFLQGAWIVVVAMPIIFLIMQGIHRHYDRVREELAVGDEIHVTLPARVHGIVLISKLHKPALRALAYARATRHDTLEALTVDVDPADTAALRRDWERRDIPVTLRVIESPYREITRPIIDYIKRVRRDSPRDLVTVYVPEYVVGHWWEQLLHNQSALRLKTRLLFAPGVMVVSVPWQLTSSELSSDSADWRQS